MKINKYLFFAFSSVSVSLYAQVTEGPVYYDYNTGQITSVGVDLGGDTDAFAADPSSNTNFDAAAVTEWLTDLGIENVDNTADADKPISTATQSVLDAKQDALTSASQAEMEAGTEVQNRLMSPLRVAQAISALGSGGGGTVTLPNNPAGVEFPGTDNNYLETANVTLGTESFSVGFTIDAGDAVLASGIDKMVSHRAGAGFQIEEFSADLRVYLNDGSSTQQPVFAVDLVSGFTDIVVVIDRTGDTITVYQDGVQAALTTGSADISSLTGPISISQGIALGANSTGGESGPMKLRDFFMFNKALSAGEVAAIDSSGIGVWLVDNPSEQWGAFGGAQGCVIYADLKDGPSPYADDSTNSLDFTATGTVTDINDYGTLLEPWEQSTLVDPGTGILTWNVGDNPMVRHTSARNITLNTSNPRSIGRCVLTKGDYSHTLTLSDTLSSNSPSTLADFDGGNTGTVWSIDAYYDNATKYTTLTELTNVPQRKMVFSQNNTALSPVVASATGGTWEAYDVIFNEVTPGQAAIFGVSVGASSNNDIVVAVKDNGEIRVNLQIDALNVINDTGIIVTQGRPFDIVFNYNSTGYEVAVRQDSPTWTVFAESGSSTSATGGAIGIGCTNQGGIVDQEFEGSIKQFIIRDANGDIQAVYDDYQTGDAVYRDQSGNANDATLQGTPGVAFALPPNIIFFMADDLGLRDLPLYGSTAMVTPELDQMAAEGMTFTNMYSNGSTCLPTRTAFLTGKDMRSAYHRDNAVLSGPDTGDPNLYVAQEIYDQELPAEEITLAEHLKEYYNYRTGAFAKWGLGGPGTTGEPQAQGFDYYLGLLGHIEAARNFSEVVWREGSQIYYTNPDIINNLGNPYYDPTGTLYYPGASNGSGNAPTVGTYGQNQGNLDVNSLCTDEALRFIRDSHNRKQPFFIYFTPIPVHIQTYTPAKLEKLYDDDGLIVDYSLLTHLIIDEDYKFSPFNDTPGVGAPIRDRHGYASSVTWLSRETGRFMDLVKELGIAENTLIVFTSDNGWTPVTPPANYFNLDDTWMTSGTDILDGTSGADPLRGNKSEIYEGGIRAPFIAWMPGTIPAGVTSDYIGSLADLFPTYCELIGIPEPDDMTGESMLGVLKGGTNPALNPQRWLYFNTNTKRAVRYGDWKLYQPVETGAYELYNLSTDLYETTNVEGSNPSIVAQLERLLWGSPTFVDDYWFPIKERFYWYQDTTLTSFTYSAIDGEHGTELTPNGTAEVWQFIPALDGFSGDLTFVAKIEFTTASTASFLISESTTIGDALEIEINNATQEVTITHTGMTTVNQSLTVGDIASNLATITVTVNTATGVGNVNIGTTNVPFTAGAIGTQYHWGYEVTTSPVIVNQPTMTQS